MRPHAVGMGGGGVGRRKAGTTSAVASQEWMVVPASGPARVEEAGKHAVMARTGLPARDLRVLDPLLSYPSAILGRERAIVVNLERVKALITAAEVLLPKPKDPAFTRFVRDLQTRVLASSSDHTSTLEQEAYPALDELTSKISTLNLERVRQIKSRLVAISGRVQKVRDELEHLLDDEMDMAEMYLTEKLTQQEISEASSRAEVDDPSHTEEDRDEDYKSERDGSNGSFIGYKPNIEELEMLLEAYFVQIDGTLNKLSHLREYVDDTEDYINIMLDDKQNQLLQMGTQQLRRKLEQQQEILGNYFRDHCWLRDFVHHSHGLGKEKWITAMRWKHECSAPNEYWVHKTLQNERLHWHAARSYCCQRIRLIPLCRERNILCNASSC